MMVTKVLLSLICFLGSINNEQKVIHVDIIEYNEKTSRDKTSVFHQYIYRRFVTKQIKTRNLPILELDYIYIGGGSVANKPYKVGNYYIQDVEVKKVKYKIVSRVYIQTYTLYDPERRDYDKFPCIKNRIFE